MEGRGGGLGQKLFFIHTPKLGQFEGFLPVRKGSELKTQFVTGLPNKIIFLWPLTQTLVNKKALGRSLIIPNIILARTESVFRK